MVFLLDGGGSIDGHRRLDLAREPVLSVDEPDAAEGGAGHVAVLGPRVVLAELVLPGGGDFGGVEVLIPAVLRGADALALRGEVSLAALDGDLRGDHVHLIRVAVSKDVGHGGVVVGLVEVDEGPDLVRGDVGSEHDGVDDLDSLGGCDVLGDELLLGDGHLLVKLLGAGGVGGGRGRGSVRRGRVGRLAPGLHLELGHVSLDELDLLLGGIDVGGARGGDVDGGGLGDDALLDLVLGPVEVGDELLVDAVGIEVLLEEHLALGGAVGFALLDGGFALLVVLEKGVLAGLAEGPLLGLGLEFGSVLIDGADERGVLGVELVGGGVANVHVGSLGIDLRERGLDLSLLGVDVVVERGNLGNALGLALLAALGGLGHLGLELLDLVLELLGHLGVVRVLLVERVARGGGGGLALSNLALEVELRGGSLVLSGGEPALEGELGGGGDVDGSLERGNLGLDGGDLLVLLHGLAHEFLLLRGGRVDDGLEMVVSLENFTLELLHLRVEAHHLVDHRELGLAGHVEGLLHALGVVLEVIDGGGDHVVLSRAGGLFVGGLLGGGLVLLDGLLEDLDLGEFLVEVLLEGVALVLDVLVVEGEAFDV